MSITKDELTKAIEAHARACVLDSQQSGSFQPVVPMHLLVEITKLYNELYALRGKPVLLGKTFVNHQRR